MISYILNFFVWLSNADPYVLERCGQDTRWRYQKLGMTLLIPAFSALLSMYIAAPYLGFTSFWERCSLAVLYSLAILVIDMGIIATIQKLATAQRDSFLSYWIPIMIRLFMAMVIGVLISHPFVLKIFEGDIDAVIKVSRNVQIVQIQSDSRDSLAAWNSSSHNRIAALDSQKLCYQILQQYESNGQRIQLPCGSSSGLMGDKGRVNRITNFIADLTEEQDSIRRSILHTVEAENKRVQDLCNVVLHRSNGNYLERVIALDTISEQHSNANIGFILRMILLALVILDITPVVIKIFMPKDEYDEILVMVKNSRLSIVTIEQQDEVANYNAVSSDLSSYKLSLIRAALRNPTGQSLATIIEFVKDVLQLTVSPGVKDELENDSLSNSPEISTMQIVLLGLLGLLITTVLAYCCYMFGWIEGNEPIKICLYGLPAFLVFIFQMIKWR
jgi:hypothetical protein